MKSRNECSHFLLERLDLSQLEELDEKPEPKKSSRLISILLEEEKEPLNMRERAQPRPREIESNSRTGPLEPLLMDPSISDILVNRCQSSVRRTQGPPEIDRRCAFRITNTS